MLAAIRFVVEARFANSTGGCNSWGSPPAATDAEENVFQSAHGNRKLDNDDESGSGHLCLTFALGVRVEKVSSESWARRFRLQVFCIEQ